MTTVTSTHVIGCGGTGGHLIPPLARLLTYHPNAAARLVVHDGDVFEAHNAARQPCGDSAIDQPKASWLQDLCAQQGLEIEADTRYINRQRLDRLLERHSGTLLIIAAVDNDATRKACLDALEATTKDWFFITPGNAGAEDPAAAIRGNILWYGRIGDATYGMNPALAFPNIENPQDAVPRDGGCMQHQPSSPQLITANAMAATLTLAVVQNLLDDLLPTAASSAFFDGRSFKLSAT